MGGGGRVPGQFRSRALGARPRRSEGARVAEKLGQRGGERLQITCRHNAPRTVLSDGLGQPA